MKTIEEAKKEITDKISFAREIGGDTNLNEIDAYNDCLSSLDEHEGREKPMKPINIDDCPKCGAWLTIDCRYCPNCGRRIGWGEGEKE
jgi:hypothetical protein